MADVHILGIDTADPLNELGLGPGQGQGYNSWPDILGWRPGDEVVFAGRYFLPIAAAAGGIVGHPWKACETKGVKVDTAQKALDPNLKYVVPLQGPGDPRQYKRVQGLDANGNPADAATVQGWGAQDAKAICDNICKVVESGELLFPTPNLVIVYLDIEAPKLTLSPDYWSAWASAIFAYPTKSLDRPFFPGLYCPTMPNPDKPGNQLLHRIPSSDATKFSDVQTGLTAPPNNTGSFCWGVWASNPIVPPGNDDRLTPDFHPVWGSPPNNRFDVWQQAIKIGPRRIRVSAVPVRIWQYAALVPKPTNGNAPLPPPGQGDTIGTFNKMHADFNETADGNAVYWMLAVPDKPPAQCG
jgi:hypothetical protein